MIESMHTDPSTPPSGDGPNPIDLEAVSKLLEGGGVSYGKRIVGLG